MSDVTISINGRQYDIACDSGQEGRIIDLASYIDEKIGTIAQTGAAYNDTHLQILTLLVIADELYETREAAVSGGATINAAPTQKEIDALEAELRSKIEQEMRESLTVQTREQLEAEIRASVAAEYEEKYAETADNIVWEDTEQGKTVLKVLKHMAERINGIAAKLQAS